MLLQLMQNDANKSRSRQSSWASEVPTMTTEEWRQQWIEVCCHEVGVSTMVLDVVLDAGAIPEVFGYIGGYSYL